ncbi:hypothetical protein HNY73_015917 [Argiope bruennichi]|uniref:Uncharacterized protein n=1 Tax=Argiope bruennichi TaxID=94029 RepID=A0A8T0EHA3_ARGBR|nr:hypothetical protein HNY73_015917 [Argiope bruennichi]
MGQKYEKKKIWSKEYLLSKRNCIRRNEFKTEDFCGWPLAIENAIDLLHEICHTDSSSFYPKYFAVAPCLKTRAKRDKRDCEMWTDLVVAEISEHQEYERIKGTSSEECIRSICMSECFRLSLLELCGSYAGYVYNVFLEFSSFYMLKCKSSQQYLIAFDLVSHMQQIILERVKYQPIHQPYYETFVASLQFLLHFL